MKKIQKLKSDEFIHDDKVKVKTTFSPSENSGEGLIELKRFNVDFTIINKFITFRLLCFFIFLILSDLFP